MQDIDYAFTDHVLDIRPHLRVLCFPCAGSAEVSYTQIPMHWSSCDTSNNTIAHGSYTSLHGRSELEFYLMHIGYSTSVMSPLVTWVSSWSANLFYYRTCTQVKARVPGAWPARSWCVIPWDAFYKNMKTSVVCLWRFWKVTLTVWPRV